MGKGQSQSTKTTTTMTPWGPARPGLKQAVKDATSLYEDGGFAAAPFSGDRVAGFGDETTMAQSMIMDQAMSEPGATASAQGYLSKMMDGNWQSEQLDRAKEYSLSTAIPAAAAQFSGSGMTNSTMAMDAVGRAATDAVAPYEFQAKNQAETNALRAAAMAPNIDQAAYLPAQMVASVGAQNDAMAQAMIDADMATHYETEMQDASNLGAYTDLLLGVGSAGGTSTATGPSGTQASGAQRALGAGLGGLGTYGMLATNPATAPFAVAGGLASGLLGLF